MQKRVFNIGDGSATSFSVEHGLQTKDLSYSILSNRTDAAVMADFKSVDENVAQIDFGCPIEADEFRVVIFG